MSWMVTKEIKLNLFLFQFYHPLDLKRIYGGDPWTFDGNLLILHHLQQGEVPPSVPLVHVAFWVHIYDLPAGYMSESVGKQLGNFVGEFLEYDINNNTGV